MRTSYFSGTFVVLFRVLSSFFLVKQPLEVFYNKGGPRNFTKCTGKHLCQSFFFNKVAGLRPEACNFIKNEALAQVFFCEFCEISKNTLFTEHLWTTASECWQHFRVTFKTVEYCTILNALNLTFNFILRKFTLNSLLEKKSVSKPLCWKQSKWEQKKFTFYIFFVEIMDRNYVCFFASFTYWKC